MFHINAHQRTAPGEEDFNNQVDKMAHFLILGIFFPLLPLLLFNQLMNKVIMTVETTVSPLNGGRLVKLNHFTMGRPCFLFTGINTYFGYGFDFSAGTASA